MDELSRRRWERSLGQLRDEADAAGRMWRQAGGYWPVDGTPPSQPELFARAREAQERYYSAAAECYPPDLEAMLEGLREGDRAAVVEAIEWLEADYFTRWTGYIKRRVLHRLCQVRLTDDDTERLRAVVLAVCARGPRTEFREVRKLARRHLVAPDFVARLRTAATHATSEREREAASMILTTIRA